MRTTNFTDMNYLGIAGTIVHVKIYLEKSLGIQKDAAENDYLHKSLLVLCYYVFFIYIVYKTLLFICSYQNERLNTWL